jgi:hypothetical protein
MDKSVLLEKRKNLLAGSKNAPELFLNTHFIDLLQLLNEKDLLNFIENQGITELKISKTELANKVTTIISDAVISNNLPEALLSLRAVDIKNTENKEQLIQDVINQKLALIDLLLDYSLKAKLEYYDSSI